MMLTNEEMKAQAERCACGGADDYCPCQNVPDTVTKHTSGKTITGTQFIEAAVHAQAMADALNTAYWLEAAGDNDGYIINRLNEVQERFDKLRSLLTGDDNG